MKTINKNKIIIGILFAFCLIPSIHRAQIPSSYPISNNTTCNIGISYIFLDITCSPTGSGNATIPPAGASISVPAGVWDISITVLWVNVSTCTVSQNPTQVYSLAPSTGCVNVNQTGALSATGCLCSVSGITASPTGAVIQ